METELEYLRSCLAAAAYNIQQKDAMLKKAWADIDRLEEREAELMGELIDASHKANQIEAGRERWIYGRLKEEGLR